MAIQSGTSDWITWRPPPRAGLGTAFRLPPLAIFTDSEKKIDFSRGSP